MRIQSASPSPVRAPSPRPASKASRPSPFSQHLGNKTRKADPAAPAASPSAHASASSTPGTAATTPASGTDTSGIQSSLDQSEDQNMQFLQLQSQMNDQSETFTTLSNVMKTENDTLKNTATNMAI